jgi:hypothetical protein
LVALQRPELRERRDIFVDAGTVFYPYRAFFTIVRYTRVDIEWRSARVDVRSTFRSTLGVLRDTLGWWRWSMASKDSGLRLVWLRWTWGDIWYTSTLVSLRWTCGYTLGHIRWTYRCTHVFLRWPLVVLRQPVCGLGLVQRPEFVR